MWTPMALLGLCLLAGLAGCHDFTKIKAGYRARDGGADATPSARATEPPSCRADLTCGPEEESCCASPLVPGGSFSRGYDTSMRSMQDGVRIPGWQERDAARAFISPYGLDRYEVTIGRFRPFFRVYEEWLQNRPFDRDGSHPKIPTSGWNRVWSKKADRYPLTRADLMQQIQKCNGSRLSHPESDILSWLDDPEGTNDRKPMTCVGFYVALLFCIWDEGRLPTEAEWSFAAVGGDAQFAYPWGTPPAGSFTVEAERGNIGPITSTLSLKDVGSYPMGAGVWGQLDLAGNAYEWVHDTCDMDCSSYNTGMVNEPLELAGPSRILRGGSYVFRAVEARSVFRKRVSDDVSIHFEDVGWRCARNPGNK
jgi:formylglycine-generating enzyme